MMRSFWFALLSALLVFAIATAASSSAEEATDSTTPSSSSSESPKQRYVAFSAAPALGHIAPLYNLATALSALPNYRVRFFTYYINTTEMAWFYKQTSIPFTVLGKVHDLIDPAINERFIRLMAMDASRNGVVDPLESLRYLKELTGDVYAHSVAQLRHLWTLDRPDLVVSDYWGPAGFDTAFAMGIIPIVNRPGLLFPAHEASAYAPTPCAGRISPKRLGFRERFENYLSTNILYELWALNDPSLYMGHVVAERKRVFGPDVKFPYGVNFAEEPTLPTFVNTIFGLDYAQDLSPLTFMTGPLLLEDSESGAATINVKTSASAAASTDPNATASSSSSSSASVCEDMLPWLSQHKQVAFINFGTSGFVQPMHARSILAGIAQMPDMTFLWRISAAQLDSLEGLTVPPNVRLVTWLCSQKRTLSHPNVKLFVSHAGFNSVHEGLLAHKPLLLIPCFVDQLDLAQRVGDSGAGLVLSPQGFSAEEFVAAVKQVTTPAEPNGAYSSFALRSRWLAQRLRHAGGVKKAVSIVDELIDAGTYEHLVPLKFELTWWQRDGWDVKVVLVLCLWLVYRLLRFLLWGLFALVWLAFRPCFCPKKKVD